MTERDDLIYAAAMVDGEGCVGIQKAYTKPSSSGLRCAKSKRQSYEMKVDVANTDARLAEWFRATFGGKVYFSRKDGKLWKTSLTWRLVGANAVNFLESILPFLKLKRDQTENALAFQRALRTSKQGVSKYLSDEEAAVREACYLTSRSLNRRGRD